MIVEIFRNDNIFLKYHAAGVPLRKGGTCGAIEKAAHAALVGYGKIFSIINWGLI